MSWRILCLLAMIGALTAACEDEQAIDGTYFEIVTPDNTLNYDQALAVRLDLFQFGNDAGGIVRYYSLEEVSGTLESPFDRRERACFWTGRITLKPSQTRFTLTFQDHRRRTVRMTLDRLEEGLVLDGSRGFREVGTTTSSLPMVLERQDEVSTNPNCDVAPLPETLFEFEMAFDGQLLEEVKAEADSPEAGQLKAAIVWIGSSDTEVADWTMPMQSFGPFTDLQTEITSIEVRGLTPGALLAEPDNIPFVRQGDFKFAMGIPLVYRDSEVGEVDENGEVVFDWQKSAEPLVGTPFSLEDGDFRGTVLFYVDGDIEDSPSNYDQNIFRERKPRQGYQVVEIAYDLPRRRIKEWVPVPTRLLIKGACPEGGGEFCDPGVVLEKNLPRLPTACDAIDCKDE